MRETQLSRVRWCTLLRNIIFSEMSAAWSAGKSICWICYKVAYPTLKGVLRHMAAVHAHDPRFFICCGISECSQTYQNFYSFKKHVYRKHRESLELSSFVPVEMDLSFPIVSDDAAGSTDQLEIEDEAATNSVTLTSRLMFEHMKKMAVFLLKAREVRKVSQTALDGLLADFTIIIQETSQQLKTDVNACLEMNGMNLSLFQGLEEVFHDPCRTKSFKHLDTRFLQEKFF